MSVNANTSADSLAKSVYTLIYNNHFILFLLFIQYFEIVTLSLATMVSLTFGLLVIYLHIYKLIAKNYANSVSYV